MTTAATPRRRADAARNDELLLDTGLELLQEKGPDRLSALDLARRAGLTTGAVYARYENNEEILVSLWQNRLVGPLREFLTASLQVLTDPDFDLSNDPVQSALQNPTPALLTSVSMLIVAPRVTELAEVVLPDIQEMLSDLGISNDVSDIQSTRALGAISTGLGCLYFAAADMFDGTEWPLIRSMMRFVSSYDEQTSWPALTPKPPFDYSIDTGHEIRDALVNAAARVIARSGLERATTQRVARAAGLPPSALFAEYQNRSALFADVAAKLLKEIYQEHRYRSLYGAIPTPDNPMSPLRDLDDSRLQLFRDSMMTSVAANTMGLLGDVGPLHRRIRLEFQLAAIHNLDVRSELQRVDANTNLMAAALQQNLFGLPSALVGPGTRTIRTIAQGAMLLEEVSHMVGGRDIRVITEPLAEFCCLEALGRSTESTSTVLSPR